MDEKQPKPNHKLKHLLFSLLLIPIILGSSFGIYIYKFHTSEPLLSPLSQLIEPLIPRPITPFVKPNKIVYGFLPYWNIKFHANFRYHLLTHLAYFGIDFDEDGNILTKTPDGYQEPGWRHLQSDLYKSLFSKMISFQGKNILVMRGMTQDVITGIVNNPQNRENAISNTLKLVSDMGYNGINIDFEYMGTPTEATRQNFAIFVKDLSIACKRQRADCEVSIDVFADSADKIRLWDYHAFTTYVDYVIVMAYDYHRPSSTQSGPVAPLRGACINSNDSTGTCFSTDISVDIGKLSKIIPPEKILLGVPYYGYQWQTASTDLYANTYPQTGSTASYQRVRELLEEKNPLLPLSTKIKDVQQNWDFKSLTPRLIYKEKDGSIHQIYYEDERSLSLKYDLVNQSKLAGIAIWALGYDAHYPELWQLISDKFN